MRYDRSVNILESSLCGRSVVSALQAHERRILQPVLDEKTHEPVGNRTGVHIL